jgi:Ser/Thr protein kinase RdoA (MazF antagonist)
MHETQALLGPEVQALGAWALEGEVWPAPDGGLINRTYLVGRPVRGVLQWVNPIFDPRIHLDIEAITARLASHGLLTPRLVATRDGAWWIDEPDGAGCWRVLTFVEGLTLHRLASTAIAAEAGRLVGRFHGALADFDYAPQATPRRIHDTPVRMEELRAALDGCDGHPLAGPARALGESVLADWAAWDGEVDLPERICHGDLKISNLRFAEDGRALCLLDFDTLSKMSLASEMGDAWRSWCNPAGEDEPDAVRFDLGLFEASARAWLAAFPALPAVDRASLVPGIERICLELAARFGADAVRNSYFRENTERYAQPGAHNLVRAQAQLNLARAARAAREACEKILG